MSILYEKERQFMLVLVYFSRLIELNVDRGMSWEMAISRADNHKERNDGFYVSKRELYGKKLYILATQKENSTHLFKIARPNTGLSTFDEEKTDLLHRYTPVAREDAGIMMASKNLFWGQTFLWSFRPTQVRLLMGTVIMLNKGSRTVLFMNGK